MIGDWFDHLSIALVVIIALVGPVFRNNRIVKESNKFSKFMKIDLHSKVSAFNNILSNIRRRNNENLLNMDVFELQKYYKNSDVIGYLNVNNTGISCPIVRSKTNDYYTNHSIKRKYDENGWPFLDCKNSINKNYNWVIYGKSGNIKNTFSGLYNFTSKDFCQIHRDIQFTNIHGDTTWRVVGWKFCFESFEYMQSEIKSRLEHNIFMTELKCDDLSKLNIDYNIKDSILSLVTTYGTESFGRALVVYAKLIK